MIEIQGKYNTAKVFTDDNIKYTVRNGIGNTLEEEDFGFWIRW